jgi:hypothetical protein
VTNLAPNIGSFYAAAQAKRTADGTRTTGEVEAKSLSTNNSHGKGHLFVVKADVTTIDCDAWLCPTDGDFHVTEGFGKALGLNGAGTVRGHGWKLGCRVLPFNWSQPDQPLIFLGDVGRRTPETPAEVAGLITELLPVVDEFVDRAKESFRATATSRKPRLALPLIGTGHGGLKQAKGQVIEPLVTRLADLAKERDIDIVLCADDQLAWSAIQSVRNTASDWGLSRDEEQLAGELAEEARAGRLVLFIGAGVSRDAGLPSWGELLADLHPEGLTESESQQLEKLDLRDHATLIEMKLGGRQQLLARLTEVIGRYKWIGLTHALLSSLGVEQAVTTNYDNLFERACTRRGSSVEDDLAVLPYARVVENRPWLLKLHGTLDRAEHMDHVVLTRTDYMNMARDRGALFGIVQALLVTRHLLFVGYSLSDEDFHQLVDEIRIAIGPTDSERVLGTVLMTEHWPLAEIWRDLLEDCQIGIGQTGDRKRHLQVFLDRVAHLATPHDAYLLDKSFRGLLSPTEEKISQSLMEVRSVLDAILSASPHHPTASAVRHLLERFGATPAGPIAR